MKNLSNLMQKVYNTQNFSIQNQNPNPCVFTSNPTRIRKFRSDFSDSHIWPIINSIYTWSKGGSYIKRKLLKSRLKIYKAFWCAPKICGLFSQKAFFRKKRPKGNKILNISWNNEAILTNEVFNESLWY